MLAKQAKLTSETVLFSIEHLRLTVNFFASPEKLRKRTTVGVFFVFVFCVCVFVVVFSDHRRRVKSSSNSNTQNRSKDIQVCRSKDDVIHDRRPSSKRQSLDRYTSM